MDEIKPCFESWDGECIDIDKVGKYGKFIEFKEHYNEFSEFDPVFPKKFIVFSSILVRGSPDYLSGTKACLRMKEFLLKKIEDEVDAELREERGKRILKKQSEYKYFELSEIHLKRHLQDTPNE